MATLLRAHRRHVETVRGKLLGNLIEDHALPRRQLRHDRHQQALPGERAFAARAQVLFEQHALVRHVLVDDPQSFAIHRHDEAGVHLSQRLQFREAGGAGGRFSPMRGCSAA